MRRSFLKTLLSFFSRAKSPEEREDPLLRAGLAVERGRIDLSRAHHVLEQHKKAYEHACRSGAGPIEVEARERELQLARHQFDDARELLILREEEYFNCLAISHNGRLVEASGEITPRERLAESFRLTSIARSELEQRSRETEIHRRASVRHHEAKQGGEGAACWEVAGRMPLESVNGGEGLEAGREV